MGITKKSVKEKVILLGDHGADDMVAQLLLSALHKRGEIALSGIGVSHGNCSVEQAAENALMTLELTGLHNEIPVFVGQANTQESDDAFGNDGRGGVALPAPAAKAQDKNIVDWLIETLENTDEPITFFVTGPCTDINSVLQQRPDLKPKIAEQIIMGGAISLLTPTFTRRGNITPNSEFNFWADPKAADEVLAGTGVKTTLIPLDLTQYLVFTPERQAQIRNTFKPETAEIICGLLNAAAEIDSKKFGTTGSFIHDAMTVLYFMLRSEHVADEKLFMWNRLPIAVKITDEFEMRGACWIAWSEAQRPSVTVIQKLQGDEVQRERATEIIFQTMVNTLKQALPDQVIAPEENAAPAPAVLVARQP
ncbi:MAG: hypothetical protein GC136_08625 [Alphaproteobacteria bacterium]|nr:hypothetical protein [Alphaproteobacteria bacterium]